MHAIATTAGSKKARVAAVKAMYAPRPKPHRVQAAPISAVEQALRMLTAETLEQLKNPGAVPSLVIAAALRRARGI